MDEVIKAISVKFGLPEATVRSGVRILLNAIKQKAGGTDFEKFIVLIPGAQQIMAEAAAPSQESASGLLGGLLGSAGGLLGGQAGEAAKVMGALQSAGISTDKAIPFAKEFLQEAQKAVGPEVTASLLERLPMLKGLINS